MTAPIVPAGSLYEARYRYLLDQIPCNIADALHCGISEISETIDEQIGTPSDFLSTFLAPAPLPDSIRATWKCAHCGAGTAEGCAAAGCHAHEAAEPTAMGKLLDSMAELEMLWGLNEPGALVRFRDVTNVLLAAGKAAQTPPAAPVNACPAGWISVTERLPEIGTWCNVLVDRRTGDFFDQQKSPSLQVYGAQIHDVDSEGYAYWRRWVMSDGGPMGALNLVTHWMPLPPPPKTD